MLSQLTYDPTGASSGTLSADQAVILAFGRDALLDLTVGGEEPREIGNVLYYVPVGVGISGKVTFQGDLLRPTMVDNDAQFFQKERLFLSMGPSGSATLAYTPIPFEGAFTISEIRLQLGGGGNPIPGLSGKPIRPLTEVPVACTDSKNSVPEGCQAPRPDLMPEVEVFDRTGEGAWVRLPRPDLEATYTLSDPARYVDPVTGQLLVRFLNDNLEMSIGFGLAVALVGTVQ